MKQKVDINNIPIFQLFLPIKSLPNIGDKISEKIEKLVKGSKVFDLISYIPVSFIDRTNKLNLSKAKEGEIVTTICQIVNHYPPPRKGKVPYKILCSTNEGFFSIIFFNSKNDYLTKLLPIEENKVISGKVEFFNDEIIINHPEYIEDPEYIDEVALIEPIYPLTQNINNKFLRKSILYCINNLLPDIPEWIDDNLLRQENFRSFKKSIISLHKINNIEDSNLIIEPLSNIRRRLAYDEFLAHQIALQIIRKQNNNQGNVVDSNAELKNKLLKKLPFDLTAGQKNAIIDIEQDQKSKNKMARLIQGDVGSGKTLVGLIAILNTIESGYQAAFMVPTSILASQHYEWIKEVTKDIKNVNIVLLTGKIQGKNRREIVEKIKNKEANIVIGTHALFQEKIEFANLGLVVIDEQHRFGVEQRMAISSKGNKVDILQMTATPIPRSLSLSIYGDMDVSIIADKPKNRKEIDTRIISQKRIAEVIEGLKRAIANGDKIYWICPLIEESEKMDLAAAVSRYEEFLTIFGKDTVGLIHGKTPATEKDIVMEKFINGDIKIIVATTVIEVGVNVTDATIMIIEHAERFGLSQLHQLRGRVGRGELQSSCILLYSDNYGGKIGERLKIIRDSNDGFKIAEEDFRIRGGGEILGIKQSGLPDFKFANLFFHRDLLVIANKQAQIILNNIQDFSQLEQKHQILVKLFGYDTFINNANLISC